MSVQRSKQLRLISKSGCGWDANVDPASMLLNANDHMFVFNVD